MTDTSLPWVSIVTPSYNAATFIRETIESVRDQDYSAIEHIVMDGGSTDGTVAILTEYPHLIWVSERDRGQSHALNKGFLRARGEIIGWLNADDVYTSGAVRTAVALLREHPEAMGVYSDCPYVDADNRQLFVFKAREFDMRALLLDDYIQQPTVFFRRKVIEEVGLLNENLHYVMDWEYWLRISARHQMKYIPGPALAKFRLCSGTKSNDKAPDFDLEYMQVLASLFRTSPYRDLSPWWRWRAQRKAWSRHYMTRTFAARREHNRRAVRQALPLGIINNPAWLANRGVWSTAVWAFTGIGR